MIKHYLSLNIDKNNTFSIKGYIHLYKVSLKNNCSFPLNIKLLFQEPNNLFIRKEIFLIGKEEYHESFFQPLKIKRIEALCLKRFAEIALENLQYILKKLGITKVTGSLRYHLEEDCNITLILFTKEKDISIKKES